MDITIVIRDKYVSYKTTFGKRDVLNKQFKLILCNNIKTQYLTMRIILLSILFMISVSLIAQPDQNPINVSLISHIELPNGEDGNDVWGYTDENGLEYAIMGGASTTYIWSLEDHANPIQRAAIGGTTTIWRDMKVWEDHIYVTTDNTQNNTNFDGLLIIDMSEAPDNITFEFQRDTFDLGGGDETLGSCHNIYIDEDGYAYLAGCNVGVGGVIILDLEDKDNPEYIGTTNDRYSHDVYVKDSILYASEIFEGIFSMYDIRDRSNPILINSAQTTFDFTHNAWLSDDGNYLFTTDERANAFVDAFDISDPMDIQKIDSYRPLDTEGRGVIPHNTHYYDGYLVTSWYTDGFKVIDANKPDNLIEVAKYDTWDGPDGDFFGCWGAYPFFPSGVMLASDINSGLYVLDVDFKRASYLEGTITDASTGSPIVNTQVTILDAPLNGELSSPNGDYKTGQVDEGTFQVEFNNPNYEIATAMATLVSGEVTILDIQLTQSIMNIKVVDAMGNNIENAKVFVSSAGGLMEEISTDADGNTSLGVRSNVEYSIQAAKWGQKGTEVPSFFFDGSSNAITVTLEDGYEDDFFVDLGWTINSTATAGIFTRGIPNGTAVSGETINPDTDTDGDIGEFAYITGNAAEVTWTQDDIDNGFTTIQSPDMDWTGKDSYTIEFDSWYFIGGNEPRDDTLFFFVGNGIEEILIHRVTERSAEWTSWNFQVFNSDIEFNENMYFRVRASDEGEGNIIEAGFDKFKATADLVENTVNIDPNWIFTAGPNPFVENLQIESTDLEESQLIITDMLGKVIFNKRYSTSEVINTKEWNSGMYLIQLRAKDRFSPVTKVVKP